MQGTNEQRFQIEFLENVLLPLATKEDGLIRYCANCEHLMSISTSFPLMITDTQREHLLTNYGKRLTHSICSIDYQIYLEEKRQRETTQEGTSELK